MTANELTFEERFEWLLSFEPSNLEVTCAACNLSKGPRTPEQWLAAIRQVGASEPPMLDMVVWARRPLEVA